METRNVLKFGTGVLVVILFMVSACKKKEAPTSKSCPSCPAGGGLANPPDGFTYTKNMGDIIKADSSFILGNNVIVCYYHGGAHRVTIKLSNLLPGVYQITDPPGGNTVSYYETPGASYSALSGNVTITDYRLNGNTRVVSGSFMTEGDGGGFVRINGQFQNVPQHKP